MAASRYAETFKNTKGPGDARPTAQQIVEDKGLVGDKLAGKVFLVTGCTSGIGVETARALHTTGADVYMTVRDVPKGEAVAKSIKETSGGQGKVELIKLSLDSLASVREAAADFLSKSSKLNVLVCNAGVMACPEGTTQDGFETQFGVNHLGHFLFFQLLKDALLKSSTPEFNSRVVMVSSSGHRAGGIRFDDIDFKKGDGYSPWVAYAQAKTANIYMANEIDRRFGAQGLHATSLMPGGILTELARHLDPEVLKGWDKYKSVMSSTEQGAATQVWAAIGKEWEGKGGKYLEQVQEIGPAPESGGEGLTPGYAAHAYDADAAKQLWELSNKLVNYQE